MRNIWSIYCVAMLQITSSSSFVMKSAVSCKRAALHSEYINNRLGKLHQSEISNDDDAKPPGPVDTTSSSSSSTTNPATKIVKPDILEPFPPAADPMYSCRGPVGMGDFVLDRAGGPTPEELSNENILRIVRIQCSDLEVNTLVWKCLGYRFDEQNELWTNDNVFPKWKEKYPQPPDFIGMQRVYTKEIDQPSLRANQSLVRSVPLERKQSLKQHLRPLGFTGYQYAELTPNKTRRAQCANWLLFYREELYGMTLEQLVARRQQKRDAEDEKNGGDQHEWKPPLREVF